MSEPFGLLIIGGGPAGLAAARGFRALERDLPVAIVADEHRMPYERPPLTKELLRGDSAPDDLSLEAESWLDEQRVDLIAGRAVTLDPAARTVGLSGGSELRYTQCVLTTGAEPTRLPIPGADRPWVHVVRTLDDVRELTARLGDDAPAAVIGSGFIGCEIASSLRARGHSVDLVSDEPAPNAARLGPEAAAIIADWLIEDGVRLHLGLPVEALSADDGTVVVTAGEQQIPAEVIVMASGVRPRSELAAAAGLELDQSAVPVDAAMRTRRDGLLAAGDVAKAENRAAGRTLRVEHWGDALAQGEIAGRTAAGGSAAWDSVPGFWSTIGTRTLKYAAWGDGFEHSHLEHHEHGGFTVWYGAAGRLVGVLTHKADDDYKQGSERIKQGAPWPF